MALASVLLDTYGLLEGTTPVEGVSTVMRNSRIVSWGRMPFDALLGVWHG